MSLESQTHTNNIINEEQKDDSLSSQTQEQIDSLYSDPATTEPLNFFRQNSIVIKPNIIWDLLMTLKTCDDNEKVLILDKIKECLEKFALNCLSIVNQPPQKVPTAHLRSVIELFIENALASFQGGSEKVILNYLVIIPTLFRYVRLEKSHLTKIYSILSESCYEQKLTNNLLFHAFKLLRSLLALEISKLEGSLSFFYFTGLSSKINISTQQQSLWPFSSGFALSIWFYLEDANKLISLQPEAKDSIEKFYPKLLSLHCQGNGGFEIYFRGENLYYRVIGPNYEEDNNESHRLLIGDFHTKTWYYLGIEHEPQKMIGKSHVNVVINNEYKRSINFDYPKINQNAVITKFTIGENLIGRISSAILFKQSIGHAKLNEVFATFKSGIQDNSSIRNLHLSMQKLLDKVMLLYAPIRSDGDKCYDIFNSLHGTIDSNSGFTLNDFTKFRFKSLGGLASILPLFYLLRFVDNQEHGDLLNELWKLLIALLKGQPENQIEAVKMGLFKIVGQLLSETSCNFFTFESVELLAELRNCLNNPQLDQEMFVNLLWRADIYNHTEQEVRNQIWSYIRTIYLQNPSHYFSLFKIKDIINLAIDKYDGPFKKKAFENSNKEWNSTRTPEYKQAELTLGSIFNVIEAILFTGGDSVLEGIPSTVRALTFKCSPYFHLLALKMLKNVTSSKRDPKSTVVASYTKLLLENNIIHSLLYLLTNTSCLDLKASCIKFINKLIHHPLNTTPELDVINYIAEAIWSPLIWTKDNDYDSDVSSSRGSSKGLSAHLNRAMKSQNQSVFSPEKGNRFSLEQHMKPNRKLSSQSQSDFGKEEGNTERSPSIPKIDSQPELTTLEKVPVIMPVIKPIEVSEDPTVEPQNADPEETKTNEFINPRLQDIYTEESQPNSAPLTMTGPSKHQLFIFETKESEANYEPLYVSLLEWLLHKPPGSLEGTVMIDDTDRIKSLSIIFVIMKYFKYVPESVKQKIIQDIYMLIKWSSKNLLALLELTEFQYFLLDTLYRYQVSLFESELKGISMAVWELGIKTYTLMMRYILQTNAQGWKHLQNLFVWIENKRLLIANQTSPTKSEKAACYLVQYIWLNLLESFQNDANLASLPRDSILWTSFIQMTFYTKYIVTTAFNPSILGAVNAELEAKNISPISNFLTKVAPSEPYPMNFESILKKSSWTDWKICDTLFKILTPLWVESVFSQAGIVGNTSETQKLEKRIHNLMDPSQTEEQSKRIGVFFVESPDDNVSGSFLKVLVQLLTCYLEDAAKNGMQDSVMLACKEIENISRFILIALENIKEKTLNSNQQTFLLSTILCFLKFLYELYGSIKEEEIKKRLLLCLRRIIMHYMCQVAYMNKKTGDFINLSDVKETGLQKESLRGTFTYVIFDLALNYLTIKNDPIITVQLIKTLKLQDFSSLEELMLTHEWKIAFTNNEKVNKIINDYYGGSLYMVNTEISKKIQDYAYEQTAVVLNQEKAREDMCKKLELEILDIAIEIAEQESQKRQASLASEEETVRTAKNAWRQLWKRFRIYVGQWAHPRFYDQQDYKFSFEDESFDKMEKPVLFSHKMSKYESRSRARPFLKVKLVEPAYIAEYNKMLKENRADIHDIINSLDANLFVNKNLTMIEFENRRKFTISMIIANSRKSIPSMASVSTQDNVKSEGFTFPQKIGFINLQNDSKAVTADAAPKEEILLVQKCQWIKTLTIRVGHLQISGHQLKFILEGLDQQESHISFMKHSLPVDKKISKEWPLSWIREIHRRRYIYRKTGIEIYLIDGSSLFFNFPDGGIEEVIQLFMKMKRIECPNLISFGSFDPKKIIEKSALTKRWLHHEISNFDYLIQLNALAGRSYKDMTQYPAFPWVLNNFSAQNIDLKDPQFYRDLNKTMGAMGNKERIQTFMERFENFDPFNPVPKFHFGSHYSSPAIILQFLIRLAPYTQGAIQLQSGKFDLADRLFHSMEESFKGATEEISDVRELIPEFFCLPDFFVNKEKHDFGKTQSGVRVHHVSTPKWCGNNPYRFVTALKTALESPNVSRALHNWIDLIFGYKQVGKEAEKSLNVYYYMTYEDNVDLDKETDPVTKISYEAQIVHFGQTPLQLFTKPHPQRSSLNLPKLLADVITSARVYKSHLKKADKDAEANAANQMINHGEGIVRLRIMSDARIIGLRRNGKIIYFKWWTSTNSDALNETAFKFGVEKEKAVKLNRRKADHFDFIDPSLTSISYPYVFLDSGKIVVAGGYWDGRLNLYSIEKDALFDAYYHHTNTITALAVDNEETLLVTGSKSGECLVWNIAPESTKLTVKFQFYDHRAKINHIHISEELRLFLTASEDGKINLYHSLLGKIFRTLYHPLNLPISTAFLSFSPLPCIIFFSSENKTLYSYSINGRYLESVTDNSEQISAPLLLKDSNFLEMLVYGNDKGDVYVRELPFLGLKKRFEATPGAPILSILPSNDRRYLFCGSGNGEFTFITDPNYIFQNPLKNPDEA